MNILLSAQNIVKFPEWAVDGVIDSLNLLPFLFFAFLLIEFIEFYQSERVNLLLNKSGKKGAIIGSLFALFPQCGFSVIGASLYSKRIITRGTLIAIFLATSDETIPILLAIPSKMYLIIPILVIKLILGVSVGLLVEIFMPTELQISSTGEEDVVTEEGCCKHDIESRNKRELIVHPIMHTINVFGFILIITLILNYWLDTYPLTNICGHAFVQPFIASLAGLIPNCAVSIGFTMMLIKGTISFGTAMSGLLSNAGLGLLVLLKNNDFKDTFKIILLLVCISYLSGLIINIVSSVSLNNSFFN